MRRTSFYRATLGVRAVCCRLVSVRLTVTLVYFIHTAEDIVKPLSGPGSPIILVLDSQHAPVPNSNGNPVSGGGGA